MTASCHEQGPAPTSTFAAALPSDPTNDTSGVNPRLTALRLARAFAAATRRPAPPPQLWRRPRAARRGTPHAFRPARQALPPRDAAAATDTAAHPVRAPLITPPPRPTTAPRLPLVPTGGHVPQRGKTRATRDPIPPLLPPPRLLRIWRAGASQPAPSPARPAPRPPLAPPRGGGGEDGTLCLTYWPAAPATHRRIRFLPSSTERRG